jgi:hypothetical protein
VRRGEHHSCRVGARGGCSGAVGVVEARAVVGRLLDAPRAADGGAWGCEAERVVWPRAGVAGSAGVLRWGAAEGWWSEEAGGRQTGAGSEA